MVTHVRTLIASLVLVACSDPASSPSLDIADTALPDTALVDTANGSLDADSSTPDTTPDLADTPQPDAPDLDIALTDIPPSDTSPPAADTSVSDPLAACRIADRPLTFARQLPYAEVRIGSNTGLFLVDWGTTGSAIDPRHFTPSAPAPNNGTTNRWEGFDFFGLWSTVTLSPQDFSAFNDPVAQAGILGTDFLSSDAYLIDWPAARLSRIDCTPDQLRAAGFVAVSTAGYFTDDPSTLPPNTPNIPTIPIRLGTPTTFPAQIDTGFDDSLRGPAVNINRALYDQLPPNAIIRTPSADLTLTTCVPGVTEPVLAHRLVAPLTLVATDGTTAVDVPDVYVFLKDTPAAASSCGGIGTWSTPAAQLGVAVIASAGRVVFDPTTSRVWLQL